MAVSQREPAQQSRTVDEQLEAISRGAGAVQDKEYTVSGYALVVTLRIDAAHWPAIWYSWLSLKGHLQSYHYVWSTSHYVRRAGDEVLSTMIVVFENAAAVAAWLRDGYSTDQMLREMGVPEEDFEVHLMRDFS
jgi:hypothetical protein